MTNDEWLTYVTHNDIPALNAWLNSEHVETPNATLDGDTVALEAKYDDDSREKLEADVRKIAYAYNMDDQRHGTERFAHELYFSIIHLLDRQAAITEREVRDEREYGEPFWKYCETCETVAALTTELESARRDRETYRELLGQAIDFAFDITLLLDEGAA